MLKRLRVNIYTGDVQGIHKFQNISQTVNIEIVPSFRNRGIALFAYLRKTRSLIKNRNSTELVSKKVGNVERLKEVYLCLLKRLRVNIYTGDVQGIHEAVYQVSEH